MLEISSNQIELPVQNILKLLESKVRAKVLGSNVLALNGLWPSLGVIDLYSFSLRYRGIPNEIEKRQFQETSSYIAYFILKTWTELGIDCQIALDELGQIVVKYKHEDLDLVLHVEEIVFQVLAGMSGNIAVGGQFLRPYSFDANIIPILSFSLVSGQSPSIYDSPWRKKTEEQLEVWLRDLDKVLARQTAAWFQEAFPKLELSHVPELYLNGLLSPKFLMEEEPPFVKSVENFFNYCNNYKIPASYIGNILKAFSICPDEQINIHSACLSGVFKSIEQVPGSIVSSASIYRYAMPFVGKALRKSLELNGVSGDWILEPGNPSSEIVFNFECELDVQPWITIPIQRIRSNTDPELSNFFSLTANFMFDDAGRQLMKMVERTPSDIDLRIQHIKFEMVRGDFEYAHSLCKTLISEPGAESYPVFFNLWGICLLELGEPDLAARYFRAARGNLKIDSVLKGEILNNLAWANIQLGILEESKALLLESTHYSRSPLTAYLNMAYVFARQNDANNRELYLKKALEIAPTDRRVFANLFV